MNLICRVIGLAALLFICIGIVISFKLQQWPVGSDVAGISLGFSLTISQKFHPGYSNSHAKENVSEKTLAWRGIKVYAAN